MIFLCDRQRRESTFDTMRTAADPISRLPHVYEKHRYVTNTCSRRDFLYTLFFSTLLTRHRLLTFHYVYTYEPAR